MTPQWAKENWHILEAFRDGKTIQRRYCGKNPHQNREWYDSERPNFQDHFEYRIKPEPKLRPWKPEEVPVGALIRSKQNTDQCQSIILGKTTSGIISFVATWQSGQPLVGHTERRIQLYSSRNSQRTSTSERI